MSVRCYMLVEPGCSLPFYVGITSLALAERARQHRSKKRFTREFSIHELGAFPYRLLAEQAEKHWIGYWTNNGAVMENVSKTAQDPRRHQMSAISRARWAKKSLQPHGDH